MVTWGSHAPDDEWVIFGDGADDVIHPGTTLKITSLLQPASRGDPRKGVAIFDALTFNADVAREATPTTTYRKVSPKADIDSLSLDSWSFSHRVCENLC